MEEGWPCTGLSMMPMMLWCGVVLHAGSAGAVLGAGTLRPHRRHPAGECMVTVDDKHTHLPRAG